MLIVGEAAVHHPPVIRTDRYRMRGGGALLAAVVLAFGCADPPRHLRHPSPSPNRRR